MRKEEVSSRTSPHLPKSCDLPQTFMLHCRIRAAIDQGAINNGNARRKAGIRCGFQFRRGWLCLQVEQ